MPIIDRHLVVCLLIMSDKEGEEDPKGTSVGSFEDLRSYFDQKFSHLKREPSDNQLKSSSSLVKKLKIETVTNARAYVQIPSLDLNYLWCVTPLC